MPYEQKWKMPKRVPDRDVTPVRKVVVRASFDKLNATPGIKKSIMKTVKMVD